MELSDIERARVSVCLAGLEDRPPRVHAVADDDQVVVCGASESPRHIFARYGGRYPEGDFRGRYRGYVREAQRLVRPVDRDAVFAVFPGDNRARFAVPTFVKSRMVSDRGAACVLLPLDRKRHWGDLGRIAAQDIPFRDKADTIVWRGGTTGAFTPFGPDGRRSSRFHVATMPQVEGVTDIGYSEVVQLTEGLTDVPLEVIRARVRPPLTIAEQLRSRFLLSLEGNDVATGLKWMLLSNSAVVMPQPTCESWACEGDLVPHVHYIPLKDDLSDIAEVADWCLTHPAECEEIAMNGKRYIAQFLDEARERAIAQAVIAGYTARVSFDLPFGPLERLTQRVAGWAW